MADMVCHGPGCEGRVIPEAEATSHAVHHMLKAQEERIAQKLAEAQAKTEAKVEKLASDVATAVQPRHVSAEDVLAHAADCPDCKRNLEAISSRVIEQYQKDHPAPKPPEPPAAKADPAPPKPPAPKRKLFDEVSLPSPLSLGAYGVEREDTDQGIALRVGDEDHARAASEVGLLPRCRWMKDEKGQGYYACEET